MLKIVTDVRFGPRNVAFQLRSVLSSTITTKTVMSKPMAGPGVQPNSVTRVVRAVWHVNDSAWPFGAGWGDERDA